MDLFSLNHCIRTVPVDQRMSLTIQPVSIDEAMRPKKRTSSSEKLCTEERRHIQWVGQLPVRVACDQSGTKTFVLMKTGVCNVASQQFIAIHLLISEETDNLSSFLILPFA